MSYLIGSFRYIKFNFTMRPRRRKQRQLNNRVYSFLLFVFSGLRCQVEFYSLERSLSRGPVEEATQVTIWPLELIHIPLKKKMKKKKKKKKKHNYGLQT